jgi:hypothetical protein
MTSNPSEPGAVIPLRAIAPTSGWHGIKARHQKRYTPQDWRLWADLKEDDARLADSTRGSPAWLSDLQTGFWVLSINGKPLEAFERFAAAVGDCIEVRAFSPQLGSFSRRIVLVEQPASMPLVPRGRKRTAPAWTRERPVLSGKCVSRKMRPAYLEFAAAHPFVRRHVWLLARLLKMEWRRGIIARHKTIAEAAGCSLSSVKLSQAVCQHFGFLRVRSGKRSHKHNSYEVCWPAGSR